MATSKKDRLLQLFKQMDELHINAPATFDDSRESIYLGCGE
ncbi:MAG: hypothetical protein ACK57G_04815 [Planctomycetota bacterium]